MCKLEDDGHQRFKHFRLLQELFTLIICSLLWLYIPFSYALSFTAVSVSEKENPSSFVPLEDPQGCAH